jgi:hypothetical protein
MMRRWAGEFRVLFREIMIGQAVVFLGLLDEIEQRPVISRLAEPPTYDEFEKSMSKLANGKAPGEHYSALLSMSSTEFTTITGQTQRLFTKNGPLRSFGCYTRVKAILLNSRIIEASFSKTSLLVS